MLLQIGGGVSGGSSHLTNYYHVDDEHSQRYKHQEQDSIDVEEDSTIVKQRPADNADRCKNCESSHDFLRSGCCAQLVCLDTKQNLRKFNCPAHNNQVTHEILRWTDDRLLS